MHADPRDDLRVAAEVFLRGPVPIGTRASAPVPIGTEAVDRVAAHLAGCDPDAIAQVSAAVDWYRRVGTSASREALMEVVTTAVASRGAPDGVQAVARTTGAEHG